jgi:hypothetical protein
MHLHLRKGRGMDSPEYEQMVQRILKAELKRRGVTYGQLSEKLAAMGIQEAEPNIRNKLARGKFSAAFMVECLVAIGCTSIPLEYR